ncbi:MAG: CheR family methyltransferase [Rectinemataceae bacterium]
MDERFVDEAVDYLESFTGLRSPASNRAHFKRVLVGQAHAAGIPPARFAADLPFDAPARRRFINAVTIGETYFFREAAQFRLLRDGMIGRLSATGRKLRCWSVSCSTGEEAVSLAAVLDENNRARGGPGFEVYASDINDDALECLRSGVYPRASLRKDGREFHDTLLRRHIVREDERSITLDPALLAGISIHHLNFFKDSLDAIPDGQDMIFFRNTLLYASLDKRELIVDRIVPKLRVGGLLFLATGELPFVKRADLRLERSGHAYFLVRELPNPARETFGDTAVAEPRGRAGIPAPAQPTTEAVLRILSGDGSAPVDTGESADAKIARLVARLFAAMDAKNRDEAAGLMEELRAASSRGVESLVRYCGGRLYSAMEDSVAALAEFERSLEADGTFWPARFYRAVLEVPLSRRRAAREFERCAAAIDEEAESRGERFACLLEGFNSAYFRRMCARWLEKLAENGGQACP